MGTKVLEAKQIQVENKKKAKGMTSDYGTPSSIRASKLKIELIEKFIFYEVEQTRTNTSWLVILFVVMKTLELLLKNIHDIQ